MTRTTVKRRRRGNHIDHIATTRALLSGVLAGLVFLIPGLWILRGGATLLLQARDARNWQSAEARILSLTLDKKLGEDGDFYTVRCTYSYTFAGRAYTSDRFSFSPRFSSNDKWLRPRYDALRSCYEAGGATACYVNPRDPGHAVLCRDLPPYAGLLGFGAGLAFGTLGAGLAFPCLWKLRDAHWAARARQAYPTEPWRWRADWACGRIRAQSRALALFFWVVAVCWNAVAWTVCLAAARDVQILAWPAALALLFPAVGVVFVVVAVHKTIHHWKFGRSELRLAETPAEPGGVLAGELVLRGGIWNVREIDLELQCQRNAPGAEFPSLLWKAAQTARVQSASRPDELSVAVRFDIPQTAVCIGSQSGIFWQLAVRAAVPGVDLELEFPVPVFDRKSACAATVS